MLSSIPLTLQVFAGIMVNSEKQRVLITAGASGIGKAMAMALEASGSLVWVVDTDEEALGKCPQSWQCDCVDVTNETGIESLFSRIESTWGGLDVLCNNAGIAGPTAPIEEQPLDGIRNCLDVTLIGSFLCLKGALPIMKRQQHGVVIFTSSTAGIHGFSLRAPYAAAKWGLHGLMKTVAIEGGPFGIRSNVIAPGAVEGPRVDAVIEKQATARGVRPEIIRKAYTDATSMRTFVSAEEIADMAVFLSSKAAKHISGQIIAVDGHTENGDPKI